MLNQARIQCLQGRDINPFTLSLLNEKLLKVEWGFVNAIKDINKAYKTFLHIFSNPSEIAFPNIKVNVNSKTQLNARITRRTLKYSKEKQNVYENFLRIKIL